MSKQLPVRFLGNLRRLAIKPGDKFVLTIPTRVSSECQAQIQAQWKTYAGEGVPLLVLEPGMKLGAIGTAEN